MGETAARSTQEIAAAIREWLLRTFMKGSRPEALSDATKLLGGDLVDSIGMLELSVHLEETYAITIAAEEVTPQEFGTVGSLARFVQSKAGPR
jgi:acyl carrier protein